MNLGKLLILCLITGCSLLSQTIAAQPDIDGESLLTPGKRVLLIDRIHTFIEETDELNSYIEGAQQAQLGSIQKMAGAIDVRWNGFYNLQQYLISEDDSLLTLVAEYEEARKTVTDSIASRGRMLKQYGDFVRAEKTIRKNEKDYDKLYSQALQLSLVEKTAPQLEELKTREQLLFAEIQQNYDAAKEAVVSNPSLKKRMALVESSYIAIKTQSGKIQAVAYKPLMERAKDYLLSFTCVAILLMFVGFIVNKLQAAQKAKKAADDMKKLMQQQQNDIPTI